MLEAVGKFSQLDILLPTQQIQKPHETPEKRLMVAVLREALHCIEKYRLATDPEGRDLFRAAEKWLLAEEADWLYSFGCICGILELDAGAVRRHLGVGAGANF